MGKALAVIANAVLFFLAVVAAAYAAQYSLPVALLLLIASIDPLLDVHSYLTTGGPNRGILQLVTEALSFSVAAMMIPFSLLYFSFGYALLPLILIAFSSLCVSVSIADARAALSSAEAAGTPYLGES